MDTNAPSFTRLSDSDLIVEVSRLAARERAATADLIEALMEFDVRRLYLGEGCSSLFVYCTTRLGLSESAAYVRIEAARAARAFPLVLERLRTGALTLTAVKLLAPHLTEANHREVIAAAEGCRTEAVKELVARLAPRPDVPSTMRKLPACLAEAPRSERRRAPGPALRVDTTQEASPGLVAGTEAGATAIGAPAAHDAPTARPAAMVASPPPRPAVVQPLSPARYHLQVTVSAETRATLRQLQDLLRGEIPSGDPAVIVDRALSLLLEHVERRKFAATRRPRARGAANPRPGPVPSPTTDRQTPTAGERPAAAARTSPTSARRARGIPAAVKRAVWLRDGAPATVENLDLRCAVHHRAESERIFAWRRIPDSPSRSQQRELTADCARSGDSF